jgi:polyhydroxyalkanoate synthesis regulator phasin
VESQVSEAGNDILDSAGAKKAPKTWDEAVAAGLLTKEMAEALAIPDELMLQIRGMRSGESLVSLSARVTALENRLNAFNERLRNLKTKSRPEGL